jgi:SagB-type dehydrogenase family enzyme
MVSQALNEEEIEAAILPSEGVGGLATFWYYLTGLAPHRMLELHTEQTGTLPLLASLVPVSSFFRLRPLSVEPELRYGLTRFALLRRSQEGWMLECPLAHAELRLTHPDALRLVTALGTPASLAELAKRAQVSQKAAEQLVVMLVGGGFAERVDPEGLLPEERNETLRQWDFHDLYFHSRARAGRHANPVGGNFRFLGQIPPQPAAKRMNGLAHVPLPAPNPSALLSKDVGLHAVMERRTSVRRYGTRQLDLQRLGEFLFRCARVKSSQSDPFLGEITRRPYPSGGASYELELYLTVEQCMGLEPGLYWYDPVEHGVVLLSRPNADTRTLLEDARQATAGLCRPEVLITLAARFQRVSWKYAGLAYTTILKNTGALISTMYLVATAMELAPCAIGLGNSDVFARASGIDYLREGAVGEFALGGSQEQGP